jgi:hypothetical protein
LRLAASWGAPGIGLLREAIAMTDNVNAAGFQGALTPPEGRNASGIARIKPRKGALCSDLAKPISS